MAYFLFHGKLRQISLAVLHCLDTRITAIGEQLRVGVAHFFEESMLDIVGFQETSEAL